MVRYWMYVYILNYKYNNFAADKKLNFRYGKIRPTPKIGPSQSHKILRPIQRFKVVV